MDEDVYPDPSRAASAARAVDRYWPVVTVAAALVVAYGMGYLAAVTGTWGAWSAAQLAAAPAAVLAVWAPALALVFLCTLWGVVQQRSRRVR